MVLIRNRTVLTSFRRPAHFFLPGGCPQLAPLFQVLPLLQLLLPEIAGHHRVAVLVDDIGEVLAGHANHAAFPVLQVAVIDKIPLLDNPPQQTGYSTRIRLKRLPSYARCVR